MKQEAIAVDVALEIIWGCDRFDKFDLRGIIEQEHYNVDEMKECTRKFVKTHWPTKDCNESYVEREISNWYD